MAEEEEGEGWVYCPHSVACSLSEAARAAEVVLPVVPINLVEVYEVGASHRYIYIHHIFIYTTYHLMFAD